MNLFFLTSRQQFTTELTTYNMTINDDHIQFNFDPNKKEFYTDRQETINSPWRYIGTATKRDIDEFIAAFNRKMEREPQFVNHLTVRGWFKKFMDARKK